MNTNDSFTSDAEYENYIDPDEDDELAGLQDGNPDQLVDIRVSVTGLQEADLARNGYHQLPPQNPNENTGTFGKGRSIWVWKRGQGTCSGRLKPITDIQLLNVNTSSSMVLSGYTCINEGLGNQYLWIKRAATAEEELDAIIDIHVTYGRSKTPTDLIWHSPGVGWIRIDGNFSSNTMMDFNKIDAFVWFLPSRTRSPELIAMSPIRQAVVMNDDLRREHIVTHVRYTLRHYIPVHEMKKLNERANFNNTQDSTKSSNQIQYVKDTYPGPIVLYQKYDTSGKNHLTKARFTSMLEEIGIHLDPPDITWCFYCFNVDMNKYISLNEFVDSVRLTDYELDILIERIRTNIFALPLKSTPKNKNFASTMGGGKGGGGPIKTMKLTQNKLRNNRMLSKLFQFINFSHTGVLSVSEILIFTSKLDIYLNTEEAQKILKLMDVNNNQKVEESEFIEFMKKTNFVLMNKADRVQYSISKLRNYLQRGTASVNPNTVNNNNGTNTLPGNTAAPVVPPTPTKSIFDRNVTPGEHQWREIKRRREKATGKKFPGFMCSDDLMLLLITLGIRVSAIESREILLIIAPNKNSWQNGKIEQKDLITFGTGSSRMYGELDKILDKDLLSPLISSYREYREMIRTSGETNEELHDKYHGILSEILDDIRYPQGTGGGGGGTSADPNGGVPMSPTPAGVAPPMSPTNRNKTISKPVNIRDVYSLMELKTGIEKAMAAYMTPGIQYPTLEEWALLGCKFGSVAVENDVFGVRIPQILECICEHLIGPVDDFHPNEKVSLEPLRLDLYKMIEDEASRLAGYGKLPDYESVFKLFDSDNNSRISLEEFKTILIKWKILGNLPENQVELLMNLFDKNKKGYIEYTDIVKFMESNKYAEDTTEQYEDDEELSGLGDALSSNTPPTAITKNPDCDYLLWLLWREAMKIDPSDPEAIITDFENKCHATLLPNQHGSIKMIELWKILIECKLKGSLTRSQYAKCILYLIQNNTTLDGKQVADDHDIIDYDSLCRYIIRMGRSYNNILEERKKTDDKLYKTLFPVLKRELMLMVPISGPSESTPQLQSPTNKKLLKQTLPTPKLTQQIPRFQQILKRIDTDNDGRVTRKEFKLAMKKLGCQNESQWNLRLLQRLFDEIEPRGVPGTLSILKLTTYIKNLVTYTMSSEADDVDAFNLKNKNNLLGGSGLINDKYRKSSTNKDLNTDEEDDFHDEDFFEKRKIIADQKLYKKLSIALQDLLGGDTQHKESNGSIEEAIKTAIRRYFIKADPKNVGLVSEDKFMVFVRKSGLDEELTTPEIQKLFEKLKRPGANGSTMMDYEKLCSFIQLPKESIPRSKSDAILSKLAVAAEKSASTGRSFLNLCSLIDPKGSGYITTDELITIGKMMDCSINKVEMDALLEVISVNPATKVSGHIDYKQLNTMLQHHNSNNNSTYGASGLVPSLNTMNLYGNTLDSARYSLDASAFAPLGTQTRTLSSPAGGFLSLNSPAVGGGTGTNMFSPRQSTLLGNSTWQQRTLGTNTFSGGTINGTMAMGGTMNNMNSGVTNTYEQTVSAIADRIQYCLREKSVNWGTPYSLRKQFENSDTSLTGSISMHRFQTILDDLGVLLSPQDIHVLSAMYANPNDYNSIDYESFCRDAVDNYGYNGLGSTAGTIGGGGTQLLNTQVGTLNGGGGGGGNNTLRGSTTSMPPISNATAGVPITQNPRVLSRVQELKTSGIDLYRSFAAYDPHNTGLIDVRNFREVVQRLQLLQSEHQIIQAMNQYASLNDRSLIAYEDFCSTLDSEETARRTRRTDSLSSARNPPYIDGDGYEGLNPSRQDTSFYNTRDADHMYSNNNNAINSPMRQSRSNNNTMNNSYDRGGGGGGGDRMRDSMAGGGGRSHSNYNDNRNTMRDSYARQSHNSHIDDLDTGSDSNYPYDRDTTLAPPKVTDSINMNNKRNLRGDPRISSSSVNQRSIDLLSTSSASTRLGSTDTGYWNRIASNDLRNSTLNQPRFQSMTYHTSTSPRLSSISPSRVGSAMWGKNTPLSMKGKPLKVSEDTWCCAVCLYMDNPIHAPKCVVCDSPNHGERKDFQLKEQCLYCSFENGIYASECEMCGRQLSHAMGKGGGGGASAGGSTHKTKLINNKTRYSENDIRLSSPKVRSTRSTEWKG